MDVERVEPTCRERGADCRLQLRGKWCRARFGSGNRFDVCDLLVGEQVVPKGSTDGHIAMLALTYRGALPPARLRTHPSNLIRVMPAKGVGWFHVA